MFKLVAIDLDGTMLNQYGIVTQKTKKSIKKAQENGIEIMIASGRPIDSVKTISKEIGSENYFISGNGSIIYDIKKDEIIYENVLKKQKALEIIKICEENSIFYNVYTEKEIIAKNLQYNVLYYHKENLTKSEEDKTHVNIVEDIYDYIEKTDSKVLKVMICDKHQTIFNAIIRKLKEVEDIEVLEVSHMSRKIIRQGTEEIPIEYFYTEISAKNVDKWTALEFLKEKLQISSDEIVAIGENVNDKNMIEKSGYGIAMGQSAPQIKEIADYITDSNVDDGVANALDKLLLM